MNLCLVVVLSCIAAAAASPMVETTAQGNSWTMEGMVKQLHTECSDRNDAVACMKYKVLHLLDQVFSKDTIQVSDSIDIVRNTAGDRTARAGSPSDVLEQVENYIRTHDVVAKLPGTYLQGATLTVSPRNLDQDELTLSLKLSGNADRQSKAVHGEEGRKSKLKKIIIPLLVFVLLKAMTLIPLAIGVLGLKAWNALQLSFFSFVVSVALAIFQLCKKIAADSSTAQVAAHGPWDNYQAAHYAARALDLPQPLQEAQDAQNLAYSAYNS